MELEPNNNDEPLSDNLDNNPKKEIDEPVKPNKYKIPEYIYIVGMFFVMFPTLIKGYEGFVIYTYFLAPIPLYLLFQNKIKQKLMTPN